MRSPLKVSSHRNPDQPPDDDIAKDICSARARSEEQGRSDEEIAFYFTTRSPRKSRQCR